MLSDILRHIELCARTSYKSEDKLDTNKSSSLFVECMIKSGHTSVLEHGTVYLTVLSDRKEIINFYSTNPYSTVINDGLLTYITTNYRVIEENKRYVDLMLYMSAPTKHIKRFTFLITTDRGTSHEIVRHRSMSFTQESTRYCNYSNNRFDNNVTYIIPEWSNVPEGKYSIYSSDVPWSNTTESCFYDGLIDNESDYFGLLNIGWTTEQARQILPNALKTDIVVTADLNAWKRFIDLRLNNSTGKSHPSINKIAELIEKELHAELDKTK